MNSGEKRGKFICIGTAIVDSIIRGFDPEPISASGFRASSGSLNVGGEAVNEAMAAAKLGVETGILAALGNDAAGDMIEAALLKCGVDVSGIIRSDEHPTPVTTMFVSDDGSRKSITNGAHRYNFHPEQYAGVYRDAGAVSLASLFRAPFDDPEVIEKTIRPAHEQGSLILADTKLPNFRKLTLDDLRELLPMIDYIFPNEDEAEYYTGRTQPQEMAQVFLSYGIQNVIIKLGARGCWFQNQEQQIYLPPCKIKAVDATGAGDNFIAGFASQILEGRSNAEALEFANACGAICTCAVGAASGLKDREQVLEFLNNQKIKEI